MSDWQHKGARSAATCGSTDAIRPKFRSGPISIPDSIAATYAGRTGSSRSAHRAQQHGEQRMLARLAQCAPYDGLALERLRGESLGAAVLDHDLGWSRLVMRGGVAFGVIRPRYFSVAGRCRPHLDQAINLLPMHRHIGRRDDADMDLASLHAEHRDRDVVVDDRGFSKATGEERIGP